MAVEAGKVCVIGIWHLGAVTSACLADLGYAVVGVDRDSQKVAALNQGVPPLYEPGLDELLAKNLSAGKLRYTTNLGEAVKGAGYVIITYDPPVNEQDEVDPSEIFTTAVEIAPLLESDAAVIVSSQVPVGTCEELAETIRRSNPALAFGIACTPENLRLGQAIERFKRPDMLVIGADSPTTLERTEQLLSVIQAPKTTSDLRSAEMTKHAINAYLATAISFGNELANLCDLAGADALKVIQALRMDSRVSPRAPMLPGLGFGGGTLARDMKVLHRLADEHGYPAPFFDGVLKVNQRQNEMVVNRLRQACGSLQDLTVGVLGLTYKAGTSTLRRSAAVEIIQAVAREGATVKAYDPKADPKEVEPYLPYFTSCPDAYSVAEGSHALVFLTEWAEFKELDFPHVQLLMRRPLILDVQNMLDADAIGQMGFTYHGMGRGRNARGGVVDR